MKKLPSLHTNTEYSLLESTIRIDDYIKMAIENKLEELVITDHNNFFGILEFVTKCNKANIKPIIGLDLDLNEGRVIILSINNTGYENLIYLSSKKMKGEEIKFEDINIENNYIIEHPSSTTKRDFQKNYFIGTHNPQNDNEVFVNETRVLRAEDVPALEVLASISETPVIVNSELDYNYRVNDYDEKIWSILSNCNVEIPIIKNPLPKFENDKNMDSQSYLKFIIHKNINEFFVEEFKNDKYKERVQYELNVISKLGFDDYFLIIWDLVNWAKNNDIVVGPGRGSSAGSLIAYILGITEVDPIKYDLLFERFLNEARVSMPDIDIDFQDTRRDDVVQYLFSKYGNEHCALISTFSRLTAKAALRDVSRFLKISPSDINVISKLVNANETLAESYKTNNKFAAVVEANDLNRRLYYLSLLIENLPRQTGTHAAGVVLSSISFNKCAPTTLGSNGHNQIQFAMDYIESFGFLKIDVLGLRNLTILQNIVKSIADNHFSGKKINISKMPLVDKATEQLLTEGDTLGVFQLESPGMIKTLQTVGVSSLYDLCAILALFRPGPLNNIWLYADSKKGKRKNSIDPSIDYILEETHGIIIYQEQIMKIVQVFSSMSYSEADLLRRAIGKKDEKTLHSLKEKFVAGARANNRPEETIEKVYDSIEKFADYGFNKSHAVAYSFLSFRLAYLKTRYPYEFYASVINSSVGNADNFVRYVSELKQRHINFEAPSIDFLENEVSCKNKLIQIPITFIKEVGAAAFEKIKNEYELNGEFKTFYSTIARLTLCGVATNVINNLIDSGAFRKFGTATTLKNGYLNSHSFIGLSTKMVDGVKTYMPMVAEPELIVLDPDVKEMAKNEYALLGTNLTYHPTMMNRYKLNENLSSLEKLRSARVSFTNELLLKEGFKGTGATILASDYSSSIKLVLNGKQWEEVKKFPSSCIYVATIEKGNDLKFRVLGDLEVNNE